jgi:hypothetical protein
MPRPQLRIREDVTSVGRVSLASFAPRLATTRSVVETGIWSESSGGSEAPMETTKPVMHQKLDEIPYYITLTVTNPTTTYATTVLLGDSYPSSKLYLLTLISSCS